MLICRGVFGAPCQQAHRPALEDYFPVGKGSCALACVSRELALRKLQGGWYKLGFPDRGFIYHPSLRQIGEPVGSGRTPGSFGTGR